MTGNNDSDWEAGGWAGARNAQLRRSLKLSVRERLELMEQLALTGRHIAEAGERSGMSVAGGRVREEGTVTYRGPSRNEVELLGCRPVPLGAYLKALGILRLVAEQADAGARGFWRGDTFVLMSTLEEDSLIRFFAETYAPTPILAPWNGGSGFYFQEEKLKEKDPETGKRIKTGKRNQATEATRALDAMMASSASRFGPYREVAAISKQCVSQMGFDAAPKEQEKRLLIQELRAKLPDSVLPVIDAALILGDEKPQFAPILGTGWNDGNLDFSNNFMQRLREVFDFLDGSILPDGRNQLSAALLGSASPGLVGSAIGQFMPGAAGGPNASSGFESGPLINPWDFILMLEGAVLFAATATRRHASHPGGQLSSPFTVRSTGTGSGSSSIADEKLARAEIWMPLWERALSLSELRVLLGEGRASLGRRAARDGLDFARAVAALGVERGITAFQRFGFMQRSGKAYLATPLNRIPVRRNPDADLIGQLDRNQFLGRFRSFARTDGASEQVRQVVRRLEDALFDMSTGAGAPGSRRPSRIQRVLEVLGDALMCLATSRKAREFCPSLPTLDAEWLYAADDHSEELRIAAGVAGSGWEGLPLLHHIVPLGDDDPTKMVDDSPNVVWARGGLEGNVARVVERRLLMAAKKQWPDKPFGDRPGVDTDALVHFLAANTDDARISRLACGLALIRHMPARLARQRTEVPLPAGYTILKLLFAPHAQLRRIDILGEEQCLPLSSTVVRMLKADRVQDALDLALRRLRAARVITKFRHVSSEGLSGPRLLVALTLPIDDLALRQRYETLELRSISSQEAVSA